MITAKSVTPDSNVFSINEMVSPEYPYELPFHLDDNTIAIKKASLAYEIARFNEQTGQCINSNEQTPLALFIDRSFREVILTSKGIIDLTKWVTSPGWHKIAFYSTKLIKVTGQLNIRSLMEWN